MPPNPHFTPVPLDKAYRLLNHGPTVLVSASHAGEDNAMAAARSAWNGSFSLEGEGQAPEFRLLFGRTDPFDDSFLAWAGLLRLVLDHNEAADATA